MPADVTVCAGPTVVLPAGEVMAKWSTSPALKPETENENVAPAALDPGEIRRLGPEVADELSDEAEAEADVALGVVETVDPENATVDDVGGMIASSAVVGVVAGAVVDDDFELPEPPHDARSAEQTTARASRRGAITLLSRRAE